jgi:hypothetical protein
MPAASRDFAAPAAPAEDHHNPDEDGDEGRQGEEPLKARRIALPCRVEMDVGPFDEPPEAIVDGGRPAEPGDEIDRDGCGEETEGSLLSRDR